MQRRLSTVLMCALLVACAAPAASSVMMREDVMRFVALGDSYTIGTSVGESERWPNQLVAGMGGRLALVGNPAVNGHTSADLIRDELPLLDELGPELVSVLIGVNDVVQGVPDTTYADNLSTILDALGERLPPERIICLATPDYTVTPQGASYGDPERQRAGIVRVNALMAAACTDRGITYVPEIFEISGRAAGDPSLVASDGLHPSGAQYALWVDAIRPLVEAILR